MTADEILKALEESEGFYLEVGDWVVSKNDEGVWAAGKYASGNGVHLEMDFQLYPFRSALEYALKDGKP